MKMLIKAKLPIPWFMAVDLDIKYKTLDKQLKAKKMLENNMELNTAVTLYELIKENIDPIQFNWELSTIETIMKIEMSRYDVQTVSSLYFQLNSYNKLSENQLKLVDKIYFKYRKQISTLKEEA